MRPKPRSKARTPSTPFASLLQAIQDSPRLSEARKGAALASASSRASSGTKGVVHRSFLASRLYLELSAEVCRDKLYSGMSVEDVLKLALHMAREDRKEYENG